jgi:hypothetical protein
MTSRHAWNKNDLIEFVNDVFTVAERIVLEQASIQPIAFVLFANEHNQQTVLPIPCVGQMTKEQHAELVHGFSLELGAEYVVLIAEAWAVTANKNMTHDEVLQMQQANDGTLEGLDGTYEILFAHFDGLNGFKGAMNARIVQRDGKRMCADRECMTTDNGTQVEGRLVNLSGRDCDT